MWVTGLLGFLQVTSYCKMGNKEAGCSCGKAAPWCSRGRVDHASLGPNPGAPDAAVFGSPKNLHF